MKNTFHDDGGKVINLCFYNPFCITADQYEDLAREVNAHIIAGDVTLADKIIAKLLENMQHRYVEIIEARENNGR